MAANRWSRLAFVACTLSLGVAQAKWLHTSSSRFIRAPIGQTYVAWRDLARMPEWSPVSKVDVDPISGDSHWHLGYRGIEVTWHARVVAEEYPGMLQWESLLGVPNRGKVTFEPVLAEGGEEGAAADGCTMELTMSYQIPERISRIVESSAVQTFIVRVCLEPTMSRFCKAMEAEALSRLVDAAVETHASAVR